MGFEWAYRHSTPPWDIGRAQPAIVALAEAGEISGRVVDIGCGTGENALFLASRGLRATGLDAAPTVIERARGKAAARGNAAEFEVADALDLDSLDHRLGPFDTVIDCGLFHVFADDERPRYAHSLARLLRPGGRYFMLCFSDRQPGTGGPRRVTQAEIRATFGKGWRVDSIEPTTFATLWPEDDAPKAWLARITLVETDVSDPDRNQAQPELGRPAVESTSDGPIEGGLEPGFEVEPASTGRSASATAVGAAMLRAAHLIVDDPPPVLDDPISIRLLDDGTADAIRERREQLRSPASVALRTEIVTRSRYAEDTMAGAVSNGIRQAVILGAGLDTFAYRRPAWAARLRIFEVDHPASRRDKEARLERAGISIPPNLALCAADFDTGDLVDRLSAAGLDLRRPAFVACLGVLIYLAEEAVYRLFDAVASFAPGSRFVFNFSRHDERTPLPPRPGSPAARAAAVGEPWRTRFDAEALRLRLLAGGYGHVRLVFPDEIEALYLRGRRDGLREPSRVVIANALVGSG